MVVAFDFDRTLDSTILQRLALKMRRERNEIWIVTARRDNDFNRKTLEPVLKKIGLTFLSVIFCDEKPKFEYIKGINADIYIDNINNEFEELLNTTNTIPLLWNNYL